MAATAHSTLQPPPRKVRLRSAAAWLNRGTLAIADQALFAGGNFGANILLARWMSAEEYGAFALAYSIFLLVAALHTAVLTEPQAVFGAGKYASHFDEYTRLLIRAHFLLMIPAGAVLYGASVVFGVWYSRSVEKALLGVAAGSAFILLQWLLRRVSYTRFSPGWNVVAGVVYVIAVMAGFFALQLAGALTTFTAFLAMGCGSLSSSAVLLLRCWNVTGAAPVLAFRSVVAQHWSYAKWSLGTAAASWLPLNIYYALLPAWMGLAGAAALRALMNLAMPVLQTVAALSLLLLPLLVRQRMESGIPRMRRSMLGFCALFCAGAAVYFALLWFFRGQVFQLVYAGKYAQYSEWPLIFTGLLPLVGCFTTVLGSAVRAMERPDASFWACVGSGIATLVLGLPLAHASGVGGALAGLTIASAISGIVLAVLFRKLSRGADRTVVEAPAADLNQEGVPA